MANIREEKGYTYGIHSYLMGNKRENGWMITTEAGRDVSEATISEVYKEMEILRNEAVDEEELMLVKNFMMGSILGDLDGPFQMIARWKTLFSTTWIMIFSTAIFLILKILPPPNYRKLPINIYCPKIFMNWWWCR
ncbi:hypothetical protein KRR40_14670 [Niabella defluvii]|nr:hypothetical protein KRR40_14670 [Niabella sp. I65]